MPRPPRERLTERFRLASAGDASAASSVVTEMYAELRQLAVGLMRG